ncbi:MAG: DUF1573 domain-containing protein [Bacteroidetes bacterium]|nr:DUF1573 domain-containing protein [Bacteroidota bacterium]MDA0942937.1 DUF1573 domain-containing protein [Bacteroidota bacterium]MDA1110995.1 DUF1573 domain-containing protein [Bacteroidota bacterium]
MALFSHKQSKAREVEIDAMATEAEMMSMEEAVAVEEATEWIAEDMVVEEEAIANYEPRVESFDFEEEAVAEELVDENYDLIPAPTIEMPDSAAMNLQADWVTRVKEFGVLPTGPAAEFTFSFTNTGTEPITITEAAPSCSCTVADYTKTPIQPGEKGWVKAVYETQGHPGFFKKFIRVEFADGSGTQLIVTGSVQ